MSHLIIIAEWQIVLYMLACVAIGRWLAGDYHIAKGKLRSDAEND